MALSVTQIKQYMVVHGCFLCVTNELGITASLTAESKLWEHTLPQTTLKNYCSY